MDSRIILTQADFSANNIGRYVEISDLTKKVLAKQTQYDVESEEAVALNTFLDNLTSDGFIGGTNPKLYDLYIPALAGGHDELLYNLAQYDSNGYPTDCMVDAEKTAEVKIVRPVEVDGHIVGICLFAQNGVTTSEQFDAQALATLHLPQTVGQKFPSCSVICYSRANYQSNAKLIVSFGVSSNVAVELNSSGFVIRKYNICAIGRGCGDPRPVGFIGGDYLQSNIPDIYLDSSSTIDSGEITGEPNNMILSSVITDIKLGNYDYTTNAQLSVVAVGTHLGATDMNKLHTYINTLLTALHANI